MLAETTRPSDSASSSSGARERPKGLCAGRGEPVAPERATYSWPTGQIKMAFLGALGSFLLVKGAAGSTR